MAAVLVAVVVVRFRAATAPTAAVITSTLPVLAVGAAAGQRHNVIVAIISGVRIVVSRWAQVVVVVVGLKL